MAAKTSIHISWRGISEMHHRIEGAVLAPPRENQLAWILAPSAPLLVAHQLGVLRPSHALIVSGWILDMLFRDRYVLMPINPALRGARIDFHFTGGPGIKVTFHPEHALFANSESLEEGVRQLINNYTHHVYSQLDEYMAIVVRTMMGMAIGAYQEFLWELVEAGRIGRGRDAWLVDFSQMAGFQIKMISEKYYVPEGGRTAENEEWARQQTEHLVGVLEDIDARRASLLGAMGLR